MSKIDELNHQPEIPKFQQGYQNNYMDSEDLRELFEEIKNSFV